MNNRAFLFGLTLCLLWASCSSIVPKANPTPDEDFVLESIPKGWVEEASSKAQHSYTNNNNSVIYANSYCEFFNQSLEKLSLKHIKELGDVQIESQKKLRAMGQDGLLSKVYSKYKGNAVLIYHYIVKSGECYYELNGITQPRDEIEADFRKFVKGMEA